MQETFGQCDQIWHNFATLVKNKISLAIACRFIKYLANFRSYFGKFLMPKSCWEKFIFSNSTNMVELI